MNTEEIQKFLQSNKLPDSKTFKITFKKRNPLSGIFIDCKDSDDLQSKNLWRFVTMANFEEWKSSKDINLSRIYSGSDFAKISIG